MFPLKALFQFNSNERQKGQFGTHDHLTPEHIRLQKTPPSIVGGLCLSPKLSLFSARQLAEYFICRGKLGALRGLLNLCEYKWNIPNVPFQLPQLNLQKHGRCVGGEKLNRLSLSGSNSFSKKEQQSWAVGGEFLKLFHSLLRRKELMRELQSCREAVLHGG